MKPMPYVAYHYNITDDYLIHENRVFKKLHLYRCSKYIHFILASFPNSTVSPTVESVLIEGPVYDIPNVESTPSLLPVFKCNVDDFLDGTYVYDVHWYINRNNVAKYKNILFSNIDKTVLRSSNWTHSYNMNMEVTILENIAL